MSPLRAYGGCGVSLISVILALLSAAFVALVDCISPDMLLCRERGRLILAIVLGTVAANVVMWALLARVGSQDEAKADAKAEAIAREARRELGAKE